MYFHKHVHGSEYDAGVQDIFKRTVKDSRHHVCFVGPQFNSECNTHAEEIITV